tara:strand:- start:136653 stop:138164 length:1512 start_codon:yes stop_codon:yes gene_type:complete
MRTVVSYETLLNQEAPIPPQCYTRTQDQFNPCYTCHQAYDSSRGYRMNKLNDGHLQGQYAFSEVGLVNHWQNLFIDKSAFVERISDDAILRYVSEDNYSGLAARLHDRHWGGFIPDLDDYEKGAAAFDDHGFARDGSHWVAFNYKPLPSTFWPTNGSTDDVLVRLPAEFREFSGSYVRDIYLANLALLEMAIKDLDEISLPPVDESALQMDVDGNGVLEQNVRRMLRRDFYLGDADRVSLIRQQFPEGTQFLHSVRYVGVDEQQGIGVSTRMKELRYMKKIRVMSEADLESRYARERKEKVDQQLPRYVSRGDLGFENGMGWIIQGFIEDYDGELRPQTYEESMFCMGCHAAIGTTIDQTFAFGRKVTGEAGWGYINLRGMVDAPNVGGTEGEILEYFRRVNGGSEFRENAEIQSRWFSDGELDEAAVAAADVYELITPSAHRALELNKAYTWLVRHQSYIYGRDANTRPVKNVYEQVDNEQPPLAAEFRRNDWDMRLSWPAE